MRAMSAIKAIRKQVFGVTQQEFAVIAGVKQSTVSRWEAGVAPTLNEMQTIRDAAASRNLPWDDRWFFDAGSVPVVAAEAAA